MIRHGVTEPSELREETEQRERDKVRAMNEVYERYGKPLERDHWGEYLAVSPSGDTLLGSDLMEVTERPGSLWARQTNPGVQDRRD